MIVQSRINAEVGTADHSGQTSESYPESEGQGEEARHIDPKPSEHFLVVHACSDRGSDERSI